MFLLVIALTFLAAKLASKNDLHSDLEGILGPEDEEYNEHFDIMDNERAIFIIDESIKLGTPDIVVDQFEPETIEHSEECDKNASKTKDSQTKSGRIMNMFKQFRYIYANRWIDIS